MRGEGYTVDGCDLQMGGCVVLIVRESARTGVVEGHGAGMQIEESEVCVLTRARENVRESIHGRPTISPILNIPYACNP